MRVCIQLVVLGEGVAISCVVGASVVKVSFDISTTSSVFWRGVYIEAVGSI